MTELEKKIKQNALDRIEKAMCIVTSLYLDPKIHETFNVPITSIDGTSDILVYNVASKKFTHLKYRFQINDVRTIEL